MYNLYNIIHVAELSCVWKHSCGGRSTNGSTCTCTHVHRAYMYIKDL